MKDFANNNWIGKLIGGITFVTSMLAGLVIVAVVAVAVFDALKAWPEDLHELEVHWRLLRESTELYRKMIPISLVVILFWWGGFICGHWETVVEEEPADLTTDEK